MARTTRALQLGLPQVPNHNNNTQDSRGEVGVNIIDGPLQKVPEINGIQIKSTTEINQSEELSGP